MGLRARTLYGITWECFRGPCCPRTPHRGQSFLHPTGSGSGYERDRWGKWFLCPQTLGCAHGWARSWALGTRQLRGFSKSGAEEFWKSSSRARWLCSRLVSLGCACLEAGDVGSFASRPIYPKPPSKCCSQMPVLFQQNSDNDKTFPPHFRQEKRTCPWRWAGRSKRKNTEGSGDGEAPVPSCSGLPPGTGDSPRAPSASLLITPIPSASPLSQWFLKFLKLSRKEKFIT